ncbi:hypothetical protein P691DRAFT_732506 [Macrolepiota fuliginosa MF-IS2]|uniref:Uncharacterized protein n=1 Tax=Macrolepiota fuliginosa MF-IS2 TaxID=1400762 RepID=A0A9P5XAP6_9AGAR|nr:hypothetical protein P691DRAFT_732506 [Macrolepiota fuliginosa MF-IS2]
MYSAIQARATLRTTLRSTVASASNTMRYNSTSTVHDNDPELLAQEKHRNLSQSQSKTSTPHEHAPGWNEYLASASEANVKADKAPGSPQELQSKTIEYVKARHFDSEGTETNTTAYYTHDTVTGPLSGAKGNEEVFKQDKEADDVRNRDSIAAELERKMRPTESEEDVKADRGEI